MTAIEPDVQWYIARDGKQYGPVSAIEMAKLVELRHLRPTDLLWRPGFADWRPALTVFPPDSAALAPSAGPQAASTTASGGSGTSAGRRGEPAGAGISPADVKAATEARAQQMPGAERGSDARSTRSGTQAASASGGGRRIGVIAAGTIALLGAAAGAYYYRSVPRDVPKLAATGSQTAPGPAKEAEAASIDLVSLEARMQKGEIWQLLKRDYADWYASRMKELGSLPSEKRTEQGIDKHLVAEMVALRRKHAEQALSASTAKLKKVATAFLENVSELSGRDPGACYSFISQGEVSPAVMANIVRPSSGRSAIQAQVVAIFEAIAEGTKAPVQHERPQKADYDALAGELTKLGWSQADLQLFADPKALAQATPAQVCKMVQDWFTAHIAISDPATQERLLVETLRPVVSG